MYILNIVRTCYRILSSRALRWFSSLQVFYLISALMQVFGIASIGLTSYALLSAIDNQLASTTLDQYLLAFVPLMYPEAFLSGAMLSILVVYRPQWVATFDDSRYLNNK